MSVQFIILNVLSLLCNLFVCVAGWRSYVILYDRPDNVIIFSKSNCLLGLICNLLQKEMEREERRVNQGRRMDSLPPSSPHNKHWKSIILYTVEEGNENTEAYFFSFLKDFPEEKKTSAY